MELVELTATVKNFMNGLFGKDPDVIAIVPDNDMWKATVEMVMDEDYTNKRGRNDLISVFEVSINKSKNVVSYQRIRIRQRGKMEE